MTADSKRGDWWRLVSEASSGGIQDLSDALYALDFQVVNVKGSPYFAKGDGRTDDTQAIRKAVEAATTGGVRAVYFPGGTYLISEAISATLAPDFVIYSTAKDAELKMADGANLDEMIKITDCDFFEIHGLRLNGNKANQSSGTQFGLNVIESNRVTIRDLYIQDTGGTAIRLNGAVGDQMIQPIIHNCRIRDCSIGLFLVSNVFDSQISNLWIGQSTAQGIRIDAGCSTNCLTNVHSWGNGGDAIQIRSDQNRIVNGYFEQSVQGMDLFGTSRNLISNCWIRDNTSQGISLQDADTCVVSSCVVSGNGSTGIAMSGSNNCIIQGNIVRSNTFEGIKVSGSGAENVIIGNQVRDDGSSQNDGIVCSSTSDDNIIAFNQVVDQPADKILLSSSGLQNRSFGNIVGATVSAFTDADATPSVAESETFITANTGATTITGFDNGSIGKEITVLIQDANTTIDFTGTTLKGNGGVDWSPANGDHMRCTFDGTNWYCAVADSS